MNKDEILLNFPTLIRPAIKYRYQEGEENDCKLLCANGFVLAGSGVLSFKPKFFEERIRNARNNQNDSGPGKTIELNFKPYRKETVKLFVDMIYEVNVEPFSQKEGLQLLNFLYKLGFYKTVNGNDYTCTTQMIDIVIEIMRSKIDVLENFDKIDLGIALMVIPIPPAVELVNECLGEIPEAEFRLARDKMTVSTNYFEAVVDQEMQNELCISIICEYLESVNKEVNGKWFREKFLEITNQIYADNYTCQSLHKDQQINNTWSEIELTACGLSGVLGPTLEKCISAYNTDWVRDPELFSVADNRPGIQKITIPKNGYYELCAWGAGNKTKTGSGIVFFNK